MLVSVLTTAWANEDDQKAEPMEQEPTIQVKVIHLKFNSISTKPSRRELHIWVRSTFHL